MSADRNAQMDAYLNYHILAAEAVLIDVFHLSKPQAEFMMLRACARYITASFATSRDPAGFKTAMAELLEEEWAASKPRGTA
jgi:hypothetical protein